MVHGHVDYDQIAASYDQRHGALQYEGVAPTCFSLTRAGPANWVLEVSCCTGNWLAQLQAVSPHVYGLDSSIRMLEQSNRDAWYVEKPATCLFTRLFLTSSSA